MKIEVRKSFEKDISNLSDKKLAETLLILIDQLEKCQSLSEIRHLKKMTGKGNYYRIRLGNYRVGLKAENESVLLLRFMHRKDIYKYFP